MVHHRNHLGILSANALTPSGGNYSYDFTTGFDKTYGETFGCKELAPGIWGMIGGDGNCDGDITESDITVLWKPNAGTQDTILKTLTSTDRWITRTRTIAGSPT